MLALALGAKTVKMNHGHHGANHPVKDVQSNKVEITSMNHGFTVDSQSLPEGVLRPMYLCLMDPIAAFAWQTVRSSRSNITPKPARDPRTVSICLKTSQQQMEKSPRGLRSA